MTSAAIDSGVRVPLKPEDQPGQELREIEDPDGEAPPDALDRTLARLAAAGPSGLERDFGYSCEWWPPSA